LADARWGEVPVAVVVRSHTEAGQVLSQESIIAHLQKSIAKFKLPHRVVFLDSLPKSALGKVQKPVLKAQLQTDYL
jgi:fatty-acyl-CoA synthase